MSAVREAFYRYLGRFIAPGEARGENLDLTPVEIPAQTEQPMTIEQMIQRYVREAVSPAAVDEGDESFEDADDFEVEDDESPFLTHHEVEAMSELELREQADLMGYELPDAESEMASQSPADTDAGPSGDPEPKA